MRSLLISMAWALGCSGIWAADSSQAVAQHPSSRFDFPAHSQWGYALLDVKTGETLADNGGSRLLVPASVVKVLTTAYALDRLGPGRRFPTTLFRAGPIENGVLKGDLWIRGGGNPALGSQRADSTQSVDSVFGLFADALEKAGIREVAGKVRVDAALFSPEPPAQGALWEDVGNYYGASPSALCFHDNAYVLQLDGAPEAGHRLIEKGTAPRHTGIPRFQVWAQTSPPGGNDSCNILGAFWNTPRLVTGTCPAGEMPLEIKGSLPDPAWTLARELEDFLRARKIVVRDSGEDRIADPMPNNRTLPKDTARLAEHLSPPLIELIAVVHGYSDNFYAAQVLAVSGSKGTSAGLRDMRAWLEKLAPDADSRVHLEDGNGLSRRNGLTPTALARLLCAFSKKPWFPAWKETLLGGKNCPLKPAAYADGLAGKVWVKTGSMGGAAALAGYLRARSGRMLAFAVMANHFDESATAVRNRWGAALQAWSERN